MFPNMFSIAPQLYPICFGKFCPPFTHMMGQKGGTLYFKIEPPILERLYSFILFLWAN
jgi:hypothetical protein